MPPKSVTPSIQETAFDCPHCGAYTTQTWYEVFAKRRPDEYRTPSLVTAQFLEKIRADKAFPSEEKEAPLKRFQKELSGLVCLNAQAKALKDDRDTAIKLFDLVNIIAEQMISIPKHVEEVYGKIPEEKRKAIDRRDGKTDKSIR